jgi:hypothetical protein
VKTLIIAGLPASSTVPSPRPSMRIGPASCVSLRQAGENQPEEKYADGNHVPKLTGEAARHCKKRYMLDDSNTLGGAHFVNPSQIYGEAPYRFHS